MNDTIDNYPYSVFNLEQYTKLSDTQPILRSEIGKFLHIAGKIRLQPFQSIDDPRRILPLQIPVLAGVCIDRGIPLPRRKPPFKIALRLARAYIPRF